MSDHRLRVDWPLCEARGICHELLPEVVDLDDWGYPVVQGLVPDELVGEARKHGADVPAAGAASACRQVLV